MRKTKVKIGLILFVLMGLLIGCNQTTGTSSGDNNSKDDNKKPSALKVGGLFAMTGPFASYGEQQSRGVQLAFDEINEAGGIDGTKLELKIEDTVGEPTTAVNGINKLISVEKVPWIFNSVSNVIMATTPIGEQNKTVMINGGGTSPVLAGLSPYLFSNIPLETIHIRALADYAYNELGKKKLAILYPNDDLGNGDKDAMKKAWEQLGGKVMAIEVAEGGASDFKAQLSKIKAANPEAIYIAVGGQQIAIALNQAKELGIDSQILGTSFWTVPDTIKAAKGSSEGVLFSTQQWNPASPTNDMAKKFVEHFKEKYKEDPLQNSTSYYAAAYMLKDVVSYLYKNNLPLTGEEMRNALLAIKTFETPFGKLSFNKDGSANLPVTIMTVKDASFQKVQDVDIKVFEKFK
ncbi:penicillin-binding protein activator [Neobacillus sp. 114]|uniref:ABC transporter substrate-binding protein n=1 Tax=Neobacillus sp. 114 TaxID=3048535 RepID=UPI0024C233AA|nr:penicillin-binding protein activator [Neobacillus sp. 114]